MGVNNIILLHCGLVKFLIGFCPDANILQNIAMASDFSHLPLIGTDFQNLS